MTHEPICYVTLASLGPAAAVIDVRHRRTIFRLNVLPHEEGERGCNYAKQQIGTRYFVHLRAITTMQLSAKILWTTGAVRRS